MRTNSRITNSIKNIFCGILSQIVIMVLAFFTRIIFLRYLSLDYLGINGLFTNIISILSLSELGIGTAIIYNLYKPIAENNKNRIRELINFYKKTYYMIGAIIFVIGLILMPFLNIIIKDIPDIKENIKIIYLFFLFNTAITYFYSHKIVLLFAHQKDYITQIIYALFSIIGNIFKILILVITKNFLLFLCIQSVIVLFKNIVLNKIVSRMYPYINEKTNGKVSIKLKKEIFSNVKYSLLIKLSAVLINNIDNILISGFVGLSTVGLYSNYIMIIYTLRAFCIKILMGFKASIGNLNSGQGNNKIKVFLTLNFINFYIFAVCFIGIIICIEDIIIFWIGKQYLLPIYIVIILGINFYLQGMQNTIIIYRETLGLFEKTAYSLLYTATINLLLSIILGKKYGLAGIFIATIIARLLTICWYDPYMICKYALNTNFKTYIKNNIVYIIVMIFILFITKEVCNFIIVDNVLKLIFKIILCFVCTNILLIICLYKKREFKFIVKKLKVLIINR